MTKPLEAMIADANQSATIMEYLASFEPQDIEGDDFELRFELDGVDTGTDVSLVEQCGKASGVINALIAALEQSQQRVYELENDEVRQRLANAEHQLYMAELAKYNLRTSRKAQFKKRIEAEKHVAELEASQLAVKLPEAVSFDDLDGNSKDREAIEAIANCKGWNAAIAEARRMNAGITVQGDE